MIPKGGIENKEYKMNEIVIDDLLPKVSKELVAKYEVRFLFWTGKSLSDVNEEYRAVTQQKSMGIIDGGFLVAGSGLVGLVLYFYLRNWAGVPYVTALISMLAISYPSVLYLMFLVHKESKKEKILNRCEPILWDFRESVEALKPTWNDGPRECTEESIRQTAVGFAVRLLDAQKRFKKVRMSENAATWDVLHQGNWEEKCQEEFEKMLQAGEKFGLTFKNAELFRVAKAKRTWEDEGCPM